MEPFIQFLLLMAVISLARYFMEKAQKKLRGPEPSDYETAEPASGSGPVTARGRDDEEEPGYDQDPYAEDLEARPRRVQPHREVYDPHRHGRGGAGTSSPSAKPRTFGGTLGEILQEMMDAGGMVDGPGRTAPSPPQQREQPSRHASSEAAPSVDPQPKTQLQQDSPPAPQVPEPETTLRKTHRNRAVHADIPEAKAAPADSIKYDYSDGYLHRSERAAAKKKKTKLRPRNLRQAVLFSEILNPPRSARWRRPNR